MTGADYLTRAATALAALVRDIKPDQLAAPSPCSEFDVRALVNHLLFWGPSLEGAARKQSVPPPAGSEQDVDLTGGDWPGALVTQLERTAAAWREPGAWGGSTYMGGPTELPAALVGGMIVGELVVHGWDLARATGLPLTLDDEVLAYSYAEAVKSAQQGREMGVYGPEVPVPDSASTMERLLGVTGRDPGWTP